MPCENVKVHEEQPVPADAPQSCGVFASGKEHL